MLIPGAHLRPTGFVFFCGLLSVNGFAFFNTSKIVLERFGVKHGSDSVKKCK